MSDSGSQPNELSLIRLDLTPKQAMLVCLGVSILGCAQPTKDTMDVVLKLVKLIDESPECREQLAGDPQMKADWDAAKADVLNHFDHFEGTEPWQRC